MDMFRRENQYDKHIKEKIGEVIFSNIRRETKKPPASEIFLDDYKKRYQTFFAAYSSILKVYKKTGKRKIAEAQLPLRLEIDQFFNWIREVKAPKDSPEKAPYRVGEELDRFIKSNTEEYIISEWEYLTKIAEYNYPVIIKTLGSADSIKNATPDKIVNALMVVHAFYSTLRFHEGGEEQLKADFLRENDIEKIKSTLTYLLHNEDDDHVTRMGHCIYNPERKLTYFADSCVQETLGWVNHENIPICNDRTLKSIRWLGFKIRL
ncbi:MAG: alcohol dehydrogenase [Nitrospirae bacterium]|nr:alcohol dehydrogenase [Nitrospirota bacterium]